MEATTYRAMFFNSLGQVSKTYNTKYSKNAFCAYQRLGDVFWSAKYMYNYFLVDGQLDVTVFAFGFY